MVNLTCMSFIECYGKNYDHRVKGTLTKKVPGTAEIHCSLRFISVVGVI